MPFTGSAGIWQNNDFVSIPVLSEYDPSAKQLAKESNLACR